MSNVAKAAYHHGDLKQALIGAAIELVRDSGPDKFSMADACKIAGVSKAAPYRHFSNKDDLLKQVVEDGFTRMRGDMLSTIENDKDACHDPDARLVRLGMAYVNFAISDPEVFKLMFGNTATLNMEPDEKVAGRMAFQVLVDEIAKRTKISDNEELMTVAFQLWTLVHGAALLTIDGSYHRIHPNSNVETLVARTTNQVLKPYR